MCLSLAPCFPLLLSEALLAGLSQHTLPAAGGGSYSVAWLDGQLTAAPRPPTPERQPPPSQVTEAAAAITAAATDAVAGGAAAAAAVVAEMPAAPDLMLVAASADQDGAAAAHMEVDVEDGSKGGGGKGGEGHSSSEDGDADSDDDGDAAAAAAAADMAAAAGGDHGGIFLGDVKLSEVKQALAAAGIPCEFAAGGRLVVGGRLSVFRDATAGTLLLEGPLCEDYFAVRDVVYGQYNVC